MFSSHSAPTTDTTPSAPATASSLELTPAAWLPVTEAAVEAIASIPDVAVRNLWITQTYADLADRLDRVISSDHTWCRFAVWASNTAGQSIREEELGSLLGEMLNGAAAHRRATDDANRSLRWLRRLGVLRALDASHLDELLRRSVDLVADRIAHGNTLVFAELAPVFVRFVEAFETGQAGDDVDRLLHRIGLDSNSDDHVVHAFRLYAEAALEPYSAQRAQRVLAANIWAVLHEQQRLQPDIAASMDSGFIVVDDWVADHVHAWLPDVATTAIVRRILTVIERPVRELFESVATALMMQLYVPGAVLHLGHTLPPLPSGEMFPEDLRSIDLPTLSDALDAWDSTGGTGRDCGATDWAVLHERMTYIVNLFRSRQQSAALSAAPFTDAQLATMRALELPTGSLLPD